MRKKQCSSLTDITVFIVCILFIPPLTVQTQIAPLLPAKWPVAQEVDKRLTLFVLWERIFFFLGWGEQGVVFYIFLKEWIQLIYKIEEQEKSSL